MKVSRRAMVLGLGAAAVNRVPPSSAALQQNGRMRFPQDHGSHPDYRTEWWYLTAWLDRTTRPLGLQITFFRSRTRHPAANPSRFAPQQLLFAHVAIADPKNERLLHSQRTARAGLPNDRALVGDLDVSIGDWRLQRLADDGYQARIIADSFRIDLEIRPGAPLWLQGEDGLSQKGPRPEQTSHYYSRPQLQGRARISRREAGRTGTITDHTCLGWLDHEWSNELLDERASGWDWMGLNLDNGESLMAYRVRSLPAGENDHPPIWREASLRRANGQIERLADGLAFEPVRWWRSPRTGTRYPVEMNLRVGARRLQLRPLMDDQELDSRISTGALYWEGAVRVFEASRQIGVGYLELTGYDERLRL